MLLPGPEARLVDPFLLVDQDAVHQRDLARRAAEAQAADLQPDAQRLGKRNAVHWPRHQA